MIVFPFKSYVAKNESRAVNWRAQDWECSSSAFITGLAVSSLHSHLTLLYFDFFPACYYTEGKTVEFYSDLKNKLLIFF